MEQQPFRCLTKQGQETVQTLFHLYGRYVRHVARQTRTLHPDEVDDIAQEVFGAVVVAVARHALPLERPALFKWLKVTTQRQTVRFAQKRDHHGLTHLDPAANHPFLPEENLSDLSDDGGETPETHCLDNEQEQVRTRLLHLLPACVGRLPYRERVILTADLHGESRQEAARKAKIPGNQIGMYAQRARSRILAELCPKPRRASRAAVLGQDIWHTLIK